LFLELALDLHSDFTGGLPGRHLCLSFKWNLGLIKSFPRSCIELSLSRRMDRIEQLIIRHPSLVRPSTHLSSYSPQKELSDQSRQNKSLSPLTAGETWEIVDWQPLPSEAKKPQLIYLSTRSPCHQSPLWNEIHGFMFEDWFKLSKPAYLSLVLYLSLFSIFYLFLFIGVKAYLVAGQFRRDIEASLLDEVSRPKTPGPFTGLERSVSERIL
jgi:hypothetical protein